MRHTEPRRAPCCTALAAARVRTVRTNTSSSRIWRSSRRTSRASPWPGVDTRVATDRFAAFDDLLAALGVPAGRMLYVQSSMDWVQRTGFDALSVMKALARLTDAGGTLVMPSYPSALPHAEYLATGPTFDVRRTGTVS